MFSQLQSRFFTHKRNIAKNNHKIKITKIAFWAILSCVFLSLLVFSPWVRSFSTRHWGIIAVFVGVSGAEFIEWEEERSPRRKLKGVFLIMLVLGLAYELKEAAETDKQAADAIELASQANLLAVE